MRAVSVTPIFVLVLFVSGAAGCGSDDDPPDGVEDTCDDPAYGDGTCDVDLSCEAPDIDCYILFQDQAEAGTWFSGIEELLAASELRPPRTLIDASDPRFIRMRGLLDEGWAAYQQVIPVADLKELVPELVVIDDPTVNAFVFRDIDSGKVGFTVMVQTGLIDVASDEELIAIVMHELTHAIRLHVIDEVRNRTRIHYTADGEEPFGFEQSDDPVVRGYIEDWRALAQDTGPFSAAPLVGLPLPVGNGTLYRIFTRVAQVWGQANPEICSAPLAGYDELISDLMTYYEPVDQTFHLDGVEESLSMAQNNVLVAIRDQCMPGLTESYIDILAEINQTTPEAIRGMMADEDEALVEGKHFIEAIATLGNARRIAMRDAEEGFAAETGLPWDRARHFTTEEDADDSTIPVLAAMGREPDGIGPGLLLLDDPETQAACTELLDGGQVPPYGANFSDDHHANCWRIWHVSELAASGRLDGDGASAIRRPAVPAAPARPARYTPMPFPKQPRDYMMN